MRIGLEKIKKVMKDTCTHEEKLECYNVMSSILDFISLHENMPRETIEDNVKNIIDQEE